MVFDITQLKKIRKQLNLTQHEFAQKAGISQSMVAKVESGRLDPTYSNVKKIEQALELLTKNYEKEAKDIMIKNIISVNKDEKISNIIKLMNKYTISQLPVLEKDKVIGLILESSILNKNAKLEVIKQLLRFYSLILIEDKGKLIGLITKSDLINSLVS